MTAWGWFKAGTAAYRAWTGNKIGARLFPRWAERRRQKRLARQESEAMQDIGALRELPKEDESMKFLQRLAELRTSTKSGFVGLVTLLLMALPFADQAEAYLQRACENPDGALPFLIGGGATWVAMFVSARLSKTPAVPGKI